MTGTRFDPASATLAIPRRTFGALVDLACGASPDAEGLAELQAIGALGAEGVHPALVAALAAVADPTCTLTITGWPSRGAAPTLRADGWVDPAIAVMARHEPEGHVLSWGHPSFVPVTVAGLVGLGPRPRAVHAGAPAPGAGLWRWEVTARWDPAPGSPGVSTLGVLDTADGFVIEGDVAKGHGEGHGAGAAPRLAATAVWRRLVALLPRTGELAAPAR